jgi:hypothetical protein
MPEPGGIFDMRPTRVTPLPVHWVLEQVFPSSLMLGRARDSRRTGRLALLIHGLAMNEDYFGAPRAGARPQGVRGLGAPLAGYLGSGHEPGTLWPLGIGFSVDFYGWVAASAMAHLACARRKPPGGLLAWGHSLGAVALAKAVTGWAGSRWAGPDRLVFEAPAFGEAIAFPGSIIAAFSVFPTGVLDVLARGFLMDDLRSSGFAERQSLPFVPGRTSRVVFTMNVLALVNPLSHTPRLPPPAFDRSRFIIAKFDRLVDSDSLNRLLDSWGVASDQRLVLPRNHLLSLTSPGQMMEWLDASWEGCCPS